MGLRPERRRRSRIVAGRGHEGICREPDAEEVAKLEQFVDKVVWGGIQFKEGRKYTGCGRVSSIISRINSHRITIAPISIGRVGRAGTSRLQKR